jgi:hypothetical protein
MANLQVETAFAEIRQSLSDFIKKSHLLTLWEAVFGRIEDKDQVVGTIWVMRRGLF